MDAFNSVHRGAVNALKKMKSSVKKTTKATDPADIELELEENMSDDDM